MDVPTARRLLGVATDADEATIRRAYRRLARRHHPDAGGDPASFLRIRQAYDVLSAAPAERPRRQPAADDPDLEARYQTLLRDAEQRAANARRLAQEAARRARAAQAEQTGEVEDSFAALLHDALAQAARQLDNLLEQAEPAKEKRASAARSAAERELHRLKTLIGRIADQSAQPPGFDASPRRKRPDPPRPRDRRAAPSTGPRR